MALQIASWCLLVIGAYLLIGTLFAVPFLLRGVHKIDPAALEGSTGFRVLIFPGTVALWPLLLRRWLSGSGSPPEELGAHRQIAGKNAANRAGGVEE